MWASTPSRSRTSSRLRTASLMLESSCAVADPVGPGREVRQLILRFSVEQVDQAALDALALEERVVDLLGDRHLDVQPTGQTQRGVHRVGAFRGPRQLPLEIRPAP